MKLDKVLASECRRSIIRVLFSVGSTNVMDLVRRVNSTYNRVNPNLTALEKEGILSEQRFGRVRMIKLERENQKTILLVKAIRILDNEFIPSIANFDQETEQKKNILKKTTASIKAPFLFQEKTQRTEQEEGAL